MGNNDIRLRFAAQPTVVRKRQGFDKRSKP
jgi:hypothetical protein